MDYSKNEIRALIKKALMGAGCQVGTAEDFVFACDYLETQGLNGIQSVCHFLENNNNCEPQLVYENNKIQTTSEMPISGIFLGRYIIENISSVTSEHKWKVIAENIDSPLLALPFLQRLATKNNVSYQVLLDSNLFILTPNKIDFNQNTQNVRNATKMVFSIADSQPTNTKILLKKRLICEDSELNLLEKFAHQIYAPATEDSRLKGAGAGLSDND